MWQVAQVLPMKNAERDVNVAAGARHLSAAERTLRSPQGSPHLIDVRKPLCEIGMGCGRSLEPQAGIRDDDRVERFLAPHDAAQDVSATKDGDGVSRVTVDAELVANGRIPRVGTSRHAEELLAR